MAGSHEVASSTLAVSTRIRALSDNGSTSALHAESSGSIPLVSTIFGSAAKTESRIGL